MITLNELHDYSNWITRSQHLQQNLTFKNTCLNNNIASAVDVLFPNVADFQAHTREWAGPTVVSLLRWPELDTKLSVAAIFGGGFGSWCGKADAWSSLGSLPGNVSSSVAWRGRSWLTWRLQVGPCGNTWTLTFRVPCLFVTMAGTHRGWWLWRGPGFFLRRFRRKLSSGP